MLLKVRGAWTALLWMMFVVVVSGCTIQDRDTKRQLSAARLIATPSSHYSTQKARYLGEKYQEKLDRLIEMIMANPKTSKLQFANNLGSPGGMGFFTHSAVKSPDERFLEVVLGTGENFEAGEYSEKVARLFSVYGRDLLELLASDVEIYNDRELSGYGLNFTWRILGSRMSTERAIVYFHKEKVRAFLRQDIGENTLLAEAVIFVIEPEGQANLLSFRAKTPAPDVRAPIQEQVLLPAPTKVKPDQNPVVAQKPVNNTEAIKPANTVESSAGVKKKAVSASEGESGPKTTTPNGNLGTKEEIIPDGKVSTIVGKKSEPVGTDFVRESAAHSDQNPMPPTGVVETTPPAPSAAEFSKRQVEANAIESKLQVEKKEEKTLQLRSLIGVPNEEQKKMRPDMAGSQPATALGEARPTEASKPDLGIHALPALGPTEVPSSSATTSKLGSEVERLGDIASVTKINPKPAHTETAVPAPITALELQSGEAEPIEKQAVLVHGKRTENLPEIKPLIKPMPKALEGYIIQVAFKDRAEAQNWADTFEQRGYAVSMTEAGAGESLRVRVGNFRVRDDAERQLKSIRQDGLIGIILNLPQAYRPEARSSLP